MGSLLCFDFLTQSGHLPNNGGQVGYGWANVDTDSFSVARGALTNSTSIDRNGWFGGGQIGYNWMFAPNWILGIEGDMAGADIHGDATNCGTTGCAHSNGTLNWFGTVRGRLGYAFNNWMLFATGGGAWVHHHTDRTIVSSAVLPAAVGASASSSGTDGGWTAGGGVGWGFAPHWSAKLEYLYIQYDATNTFTYGGFPTADRRNESTTHLNLVRLGVNYLFN
jgi:outer membrane immunogenic protein